MKNADTIPAQAAPGKDLENLKSKAKAEDILFCMYSGLPEPPTLNAILVLAQYFKSVTMLRNNLDFPAESYPHTPILKETGARLTRKEAAEKSAAWKMARFAQYCWALFNQLRSGKYKLVVIHDYLALLAWWLVKNLAGYKGLVWFNSYDVIDMEHEPMGRFSLMRLVVNNHEKIFSELDFFSLPAAERKPYYPCDRVKKEVFVIPNYPSSSFYRPFYKPGRLQSQDAIKMIYQGALGPGHGYEDFIKILDKKVKGKPLQLILKGWISEEYKKQLVELAEKHGVADRLIFKGFSLYRSVPELASTCTIGLAIFTKNDVMNKTLGSASNKIYEYAAVGLPVILYDTPHFREYLGQWVWAFFTDLSATSILNCIENIMEDYPAAAQSAHESFEQEYNFEKVFKPASFSVMEAMFS